jgi:hypothetical protein
MRNPLSRGTCQRGECRTKAQSPLAPHTAEQETEPLPNTEGSNNFVPAEHGPMETEEPQDPHFTKQNDDSYGLSMTTGRRLNTPPPDNKSAERENDERGMGLSIYKQPTGDESKFQDDTGTSPKRSKKTRVDRHGSHSQERSHCLPRRTPYKGKT